MQYSAVSNQNLFDITTQQFGDIEFFFTLLADNDLSVNSVIRENQLILLNVDGVGNQDIKDLVIKNNLKFVNNQSDQIPPLYGGDFNNDFNNDFY